MHSVWKKKENQLNFLAKKLKFAELNISQKVEILWISS